MCIDSIFLGLSQISRLIIGLGLIFFGISVVITVISINKHNEKKLETKIEENIKQD